MKTSPPRIAQGNLDRKALSGQVAIVTGGGRGIGCETARALAWLGAHVVIAECDPATGTAAQSAICAEMGAESAWFIQTDVGDEASVAKLAQQVLGRHERADIVINNATVTPMGAVVDVPIADWDLSYRVNLRGPVLLAQAFLPGMLARDAGVFVCVSSVGTAYMGAYEILKSAQVNLAQTLDAELEGSGVIAFTIGPGLVRTPGLQAALPKVAALYGKTPEEFIALAKDAEMSVEAAGAGFAAAVALADRFRGMEIGAIASLQAAGIPWQSESSVASELPAERRSEALALCRQVHRTLAVQADGWRQRPFFEKQFMLRDFKNYAGMTVEHWLAALDELEQHLADGGKSGPLPPVAKLARFYAHLQDLARGYIKDPAQLAQNLATVQSWQQDAARLEQLLG